MMKEMFYSFSERTRYLRFHGPMKAFPHERLQVFCNVDYKEEMALIGLTGDPGNEEVVAVGAYTHNAADNSAEVAFTVRDDWQNKGLGTSLFNHLVRIGRERGIEQFEAEVLPENVPMLSVFNHSNCHVTTHTEGGVVHVTIILNPKDSSPAEKK